MLRTPGVTDRFLLQLQEHELNKCSSKSRSVPKTFAHHYIGDEDSQDFNSG